MRSYDKLPPFRLHFFNRREENRSQKSEVKVEVENLRIQKQKPEIAKGQKSENYQIDVLIARV
jgi:hypothetical protein